MNEFRGRWVGPLLVLSCTLGGCTIWPPDVPDVSLPGTPLRFVVLGDTGAGNTTQFEVGKAIEDVCTARGCDFILLLGDYIYPTGVDGPTDAQFADKFELPYENVDATFYVALGNHDYGGGGAGYEYEKAGYQIEYSEYSEKWKLPAHHYGFKVVGGPATVDFFALDTNSMFYRLAFFQKLWLRRVLDESTANWKIAFGHHTYKSNGEHGNAGNYDELGTMLGTTSEVTGQRIKEFFDEHLCGKVDLYLAAHDHSMQLLQPQCGMELIVSGSGAKTTDIRMPRFNPWRWDSSRECTGDPPPATDGEVHKAGFVYIEINNTTSMNVDFYLNDAPNPPKLCREFVIP